MIQHIAWNDAYKVGHPMIDSQHQRLFELADNVYSLVNSNTESQREKVEQVIQECAEYVIFHFSCEEELMAEVGYSAMEAHKALHRDFNNYVSTLVGDFLMGKEVNLGELYSYIANWLVKHIMAEDKKLAEHAASR